MMNCKSKNYIKWLVVIFVSLALMVHIWNYNKHKMPHPTTVTGNHRMETSIVNPSIDISLPLTNRRNYVNFRIIVITFNRPSSLERLLKSLNDADYLDEKVVIEIWIDRSNSGHIDENTYIVAKRFLFKKGISDVFNHSTHVGIYGQWMGLWQPDSDSKEIAVILEDDLTVSPHFYRYLKNVHRKYDKMKDINGFALQCSMKHGGESGNLQAPYDHIVFKYPIIGTWGFSPKNNNWLNFTKWYKIQSLKKEFYPLVPGILPTNWYKEFMRLGKTDTMWEMWHIYYAWSNGEKTVYPNLPNCEALSVNWREIGLHYKVNQKVTDRLIFNWDTRFDNLPDNLIELDSHGNIVK